MSDCCPVCNNILTVFNARKFWCDTCHQEYRLILTASNKDKIDFCNNIATFNSDKYLLSYEDLWDLKFNQFFKDDDENTFKLAIKKYVVNKQ